MFSVIPEVLFDSSGLCRNATRLYLPFLCMRECMQGILNHCLEMEYNIEHAQSKITLLRAVSFGFLPTYQNT